MKASKLLQYLTVLENENKRLFENLDVCVMISTDAPSVGPTPTVGIRSA